MDKLGHMLLETICNLFADRLRQAPDRRLQLVFSGAPLQVLERMFHIATQSGSQDWAVSVNGSAQKVPVLLVTQSSREAKPPAVACKSAVCDWDYAVRIRNNHRLSVVLADPRFAEPPESIGNATENMGAACLRPTVSMFEHEPWISTSRVVAEHLGLDMGTVSSALVTYLRSLDEIAPDARAMAPWQAIDRVLSEEADPVSPLRPISRAIGLPAVLGTRMEGQSKELHEGFAVLALLAEFLGGKTFEAGFQELKQAKSVQQCEELGPALDEMCTHLQARSLTTVAFKRAPAWYFQPPAAADWWDVLKADILKQILKECGAHKEGRLALRCTNAVATIKATKEVALVDSEVHLEVKVAGGTIPDSIDYFKRNRGQRIYVGRGSTTFVDTDTTKNTVVMDYYAEADGVEPASVKVLSLDSFEPGILVSVPHAEKVSLPTRKLEQDVSLAVGGATRVLIYHAHEVTVDRVLLDGEKVELHIGSPVEAYVEVDHDAELVVEFTRSKQKSQLTVRFSVLEDDEIEMDDSFFGFLIRANEQPERNTPRFRVWDTWTNRVNKLYLGASNSWRPVSACWKTKWPGVEQSVDWSQPRMGDFVVDPDPRPSVLTPPEALLAARETIRLLLNDRGNLVELDFTDLLTVEVVNTYLRHYTSWLAADPGAAFWFDLISIHGLEGSHGRIESTAEPVALLLSPLHPIRMAWQFHAQRILKDSWKNQGCSLAAMVDPFSTPDLGALSLSFADSSHWRAYVGLGGSDPYWGILWNSNELAPREATKLVSQQLRSIHVGPTGIAPGFTNSQAKRALNDATMLLPARARMRIGIVSEPAATFGCFDGVLEWCEEALGSEQPAGPSAVDIFDSRSEFSTPSPEELALLSRQTDQRVRWFCKSDEEASVPTQDLVLIDELEATRPLARRGDVFSALGPNALFRLRVRRDKDDAEFLVETRASKTGKASNADPLGTAVVMFEGTAAEKTGEDQLWFTPSVSIVNKALDSALYVAATSGQLDPSCIVRGIRRRDAYLWDYTLPAATPSGPSSVGYYLIANPNQSVPIKTAVQNAARIAAGVAVDVNELLGEISSRGIPILKRLAAGGNQSQGEVGLLLASRLLQDAFRGTSLGLPVFADGILTFVIPVDPYEQLLSRIRKGIMGGSSEQRGDLLIVSMRLPDNNTGAPLCVRVTPVEVKYRTDILRHEEERDALGQASNLGQLLRKLWSTPETLPSEAWKNLAPSVLAHLVDYAFRVYADKTVHGLEPNDWERLHGRVLLDIVSGQTAVDVDELGMLVVFDDSAVSEPRDVDGNDKYDTLVVCREDTRRLMQGDPTLAEEVRELLGWFDLSAACPSRATALQKSESAGSKRESVIGFTDTAGDEPTRSQTPMPLNSNHGANVALPTPTEGQVLEAEDGELLVNPQAPNDQNRGEAGEQVESAGSAKSISADAREKVEHVFTGFVGNERAVKRLKKDLLWALLESPPHLPRNYLFTGMPSTGKTELVRRVAKGLELPFVKLDGKGVDSREKLFSLIDAELAKCASRPQPVSTSGGRRVLAYPPFVVFVDEVHLMARGVQESLLTALESGDRSVPLADRTALIPKATFLFATTRSSELDSAFRTRCTEVALQEYSVEEVAIIVQRKHAEWSKSVCTEIAKRARCVPRIALDIAKELEMACRVADIGETVEESLEEVCHLLDIDALGLTQLDYDYLRLLDKTSRPLGESAILNMLRTADKDRIVNEVEPYVIGRLGFAALGPQGREITPEGRRHLRGR